MYIHSEREIIRKSPWREFLKFQVNETNFSSVFLVKKCMHQIYDVWNFIMRIEACVHCFYFCYKNKTFKKLSKILFVLPKNILLSSRYQVFVLHFSPLFSFLDRCWFLMINSKVHVPKLDFKNTDCLISGKVKFWSWYLVNW